MPPLVKDYLEFQKLEILASPSSANPALCLQTFFTTDGLTELLGRILDSLQAKFNRVEPPPPGPVSTLLTGGYGTGKSHLLALLYALLAHPESKGPILSAPQIHATVKQLRQLNILTLWLDLAKSPQMPLPELVLSRLNQEFETRFNRHLVDPSTIPGIALIKAHEIINFKLTAEGPIFLIVDGLSKRALERTVPQLNEDIEFLSLMGFSSKSTPLFVLVAAHEDFFSATSPLGIDSVLMAQTLENFKIEWIDRANLREVICRQVLKKNIRQQQDLGKLYSFIKLKLPSFQPNEKDFADAYPYHPLIFELAEKVRARVPDFSLFDFIINTYPRVASHRAISIATVDYLFDRIEFDLKNTPALKNYYEVYLRLSEKTLARQEGRWKLWGKMLLKSIFLFTVANRTPTVRELGDSLLLFEDTESGLSYNAVGMLLAQMEKAAEADLVASGDRLDRTYRFRIADAREEFDKHLERVASQIPDQDTRLAQILLTAAERFFPDWPFRLPLAKGQLSEPVPLSIVWNGTERSGLFVYSQNFLGSKASSQDLERDRALSQRLPEMLPPGSLDETPLPVQASVPAPLATGAPEIEWIFWMEPIGLESNAFQDRPSKVTEVHWIPGSPAGDELTQLKRILALHLVEQSAAAGLPPSEIQRIRDDFRLDLGQLFQELYLARGRIMTHAQNQALNQGHYECRTFQAFLNYVFRPSFRDLYPLHPDFQDNRLTDDLALTIARKLFASQAPTDSDVQKLAGQFAMPLGVVSRQEHLYELNLSITPPPFITDTIQYLETLDAAEQQVALFYHKLHQSPCGMTLPSFHLILAALVADGQIELVDPATAVCITRENLATLEEFQSYQIFRKIQTHREFPAEVLTQWVRMITGNQEISDISASRGRSSAIAALNDWMAHWKKLGISQNLETLPNQILTTQMWTKLAWTKRRFDQVAEILESIFSNQLTLIQGMAKIIDLFGENVSQLEKASRNLVELSLFFDWLDHFTAARNYILAAEKTGDAELDQKREQLVRWMETPHELVQTEKSREFEKLFESFKTRYIEYYSVRHDQSLGPMSKFELLNELENSAELRNLQLLSSLPMGDLSYLQCLEEWMALVRSHRCHLPVRELLQQIPHCQCGFKLSRPASITQVVADFQHFLDVGIAHHKQVLNYFRPSIEAKLKSGTPAETEDSQALLAILDAEMLPPLTQTTIDQLAELLGDIVIEEKITAPLPLLVPAGRITKKHLQTQIQKWLDSLSDRDDVLLSLKEL